MWSRSRLSPRTSWRLKAPRTRSVAIISQSPLRATRSAFTVSTLRSTSRSMLSGLTPGRSNSITNRSPSRQASMGMTAGRFVVPQVGPKTCWVSRSKSRNGSVLRSNITVASLSLLGWMGCETSGQWGQGSGADALGLDRAGAPGHVFGVVGRRRRCGEVDPVRWRQGECLPRPGVVAQRQRPRLSGDKVGHAQGLPELRVLVAGQDGGYAAAHRGPMVVGADLHEPGPRVRRLPGHDGGTDQHTGPGDELRRAVEGDGDVAADIELAAGLHQDRDLARFLGRVHLWLRFWSRWASGRLRTGARGGRTERRATGVRESHHLRGGVASGPRLA